LLNLKMNSDNNFGINTQKNPKLEIKKGLRAFVSPGQWSYVINEKGNALRMTFQQFGSCTPELFLEGYIVGLSEKEKRKLSKQCDEAKDTID